MFVAGLVVACAVVTAHGSPPAGADTCATNDFCVFGASWYMPSPSGTLGAKVTLRSNCMDIDYLATDSFTHRLTVHSVNTSGRLELGIFRGNFAGLQASQPRRYFFSANATDASIQLSQFGYSYGSALDATIYKPTTASSEWRLWFGDTIAPYRYEPVYTFSGPARRLQATTTSSIHQNNPDLWQR